MPQHCAAYGCTTRRSLKTRQEGITFHKFPPDPILKKAWETAARSESFCSSASAVLCSQHFKEADIDRTGQIVRIREGAVPSAFSFSAKTQKEPITQTVPVASPAASLLDLTTTQKDDAAQILPLDEHMYAAPPSPDKLKDKLYQALARVEELERQLRNARDRQRRCKTALNKVLEDLKEKNLIVEDLTQKLELYSDISQDLLSKEGHSYNKKQKEFATALYQHGSKVYSFLRDSLHLPLPHPHTLQRWMQSTNEEPETDSS